MILDGKTASSQLFDKLLQRINRLPRKPLLAAVQVGDNPASSLYIRLKKKTLEKLGLGFRHVHLSENATQIELIAAIEKLNLDGAVHGILLQLPLPAHFDTAQALNTILPEKDPDCLTTQNLGRFCAGESSIMPATPLGVVRLLEYYNIPVEGRNVCIVGRSNLVGKPLAIALTAKNATVTLCHSKTKEIEKHTCGADIVVTAIGRADFFGKEYFREHQTVIDVGTSTNDQGRISGDVHAQEVASFVENITPVPGGVGPMTIYGLMENLVTLAEQANS
jgi:methylenetetrahydrofolate dehydrogenase (NADP+)/methenyltetrahydrofolate cyclohydrolase